MRVCFTRGREDTRKTLPSPVAFIISSKRPAASSWRDAPLPKRSLSITLSLPFSSPSAPSRLKRPSWPNDRQNQVASDCFSLFLPLLLSSPVVHLPVAFLAPPSSPPSFPPSLPPPPPQLTTAAAPPGRYGARIQKSTAQALPLAALHMQKKLKGRTIKVLPKRAPTWCGSVKPSPNS